MSSDLREAFIAAARAVSAANVNFYVTGGLAVGVHGEPRFTQDIDLVVQLEGLPEVQIEKLIAELSKEFLVNPDLIRSAAKSHQQFQALHQELLFKIDFHIGEAIQGQFARAETRMLFEGVSAKILSRPDTILTKLIWTAKGSGKSRQDLNILLRAATESELKFVREECVARNLLHLFDELMNEFVYKRTPPKA